MFISRSLGPKNRILGRFGLEVEFISLMGLMTKRVAFTRRNRWKKAMKIPEQKSATSAILEVASVFMKSRRWACTSTGITMVYWLVSMIEWSDQDHIRRSAQPSAGNSTCAKPQSAR